MWAGAFACNRTRREPDVGQPLPPANQRVPRPKTAAERKQRLDEILLRLDRMYPGATCALHHNNPWELLVATILSAPVHR